MGLLRRFHERHLHPRMRVDYRLNLLRVDLHAADVDYTVPSADEIVSVSAQLDHVVSVDEAILVNERFARASEIADAVRSERIRSEPSSTFISTSAPRRPIRLAGKPARPSRTSKPYACLGRSERMDDRGRRVARAKVVQDRLVHYLSGQANVSRRDLASRRTHQRAAPMGRSPRNMRDAMRSRPSRESPQSIPVALESTSDPPSRSARKKICRPP